MGKWGWFFTATIALLVASLGATASTFAPKLCEALLRTQNDLTVAPAASEQTPAWELGSTPLQRRLKRPRARRPRIPRELKAHAEETATLLRERLGVTKAEFEIWPTIDDRGRPRWVFARYRIDRRGAWQWLTESLVPELTKLSEEATTADKLIYGRMPILPRRLSVVSNHDELFRDPLNGGGLYEKPLFGDAVFVHPTNEREPLLEWPHPSARVDALAHLPPESIAYILPQPAHFNGKEVRFHVRINSRGVHWSETMRWVNDSRPNIFEEVRVNPVIADWGTRFKDEYEADLLALSGETNLPYPPQPGSQMRLQRKNNAEPDHQLEELLDYLVHRYERLGLKSFRHHFRWNQRTHSNLVTVIKGSLPPNENKPVILADHIDTAYAEDVFARRKHRVSTSGADDNVTATAALLRAAEVFSSHFKDTPPLHDIWLLNLTGEEFPADSLGARHFVQALLEAGQQISGLILLDMIGYHASCTERCRSKFQISMGASPGSGRLAAAAMSAAFQQAPELEALMRHPRDDRSYLFNTDGIIFSRGGFPVILINEHLNFHEHFDREHYHASTDTPEHVDVDYAVAITKVALEAAARIATSEDAK